LSEQQEGEGAPAPEGTAGTGGQEPRAPAAATAAGQPPRPTPEEQALQDRYLRLAAEFDNFRKRTERDMTEYRKRAQDTILVSVLDILDSLDRALEAPSPAEAAKLREGVAAIRAQLWQVLDREGVRPIEALGRRFDPFEMEASLRMSSADVPEGGVVREIQRGYKGRYHVLRPSKVIVSSGPPPAGEAAPASDAPSVPKAPGSQPQHHSHQSHQSHQQSHHVQKHPSEESKE